MYKVFSLSRDLLFFVLTELYTVYISLCVNKTIYKGAAFLSTSFFFLHQLHWAQLHSFLHQLHWHSFILCSTNFIGHSFILRAAFLLRTSCFGRQFPIRVCFGMTLNKSQGQSLDLVEVDLRTSCFSHG